MKYMTKTSREAGVCPSFDVFCCGDDCMDWVPGDCTRALAAKAAKVSGWIFNYKKGWLCPICSKQLEATHANHD